MLSNALFPLVSLGDNPVVHDSAPLLLEYHEVTGATTANTKTDNVDTKLTEVLGIYNLSLVNGVNVNSVSVSSTGVITNGKTPVVTTTTGTGSGSTVTSRFFLLGKVAPVNSTY